MRRSATAHLLWPISRLFAVFAARRRKAARPSSLGVPVVVVGGITVGGSGKTPLTLYLVEVLHQHGYRPGIISRGYGGKLSGEPGGVSEVLVGDDPRRVGDEPLLLRERSGVPVFVGADRVATGQALRAAHPDVDLVISDDGLQHYRLARNVEIVVLDRRGLGNGWQLPAGPLREGPERLAQVDAVVLNDVRADAVPGLAGMPVFHMRLAGSTFVTLADASISCTPEELAHKRLHAVAGIGEPQRFFDHLLSLGMNFTAHAFPDHHAYTTGDIDFGFATLLTTEKDAVKLRSVLPPGSDVWVLPVSAELEPGLDQLIVEKLNGRAPA